MNAPSVCFSVTTRLFAGELPTGSRLEGLSDDLFRERAAYKKLNGLGLGILSLLDFSLLSFYSTLSPF